MSTSLIIRTSDRQLFKRCRRRWNFGSSHRHNRTSSQPPSYFWFGTVGHFALEDFHGYNYYGHPVAAARAALQAMKVATKRRKSDGKELVYELPDDWEDQFHTLEGVLNHYIKWLEGRNTFETYWFNGKPQLEVRVRIPLPISKKLLTHYGYNAEDTEVFYEATFDRVMIDREDGNLWIQDYKFFKQFMTEHLDFDEQASSYIWAANCVYPELVEGFAYLQFRKAVPAPPERTSTGLITTNMQVLPANTTHALYREAVIDAYISVKRAPPQYRRVLGELAVLETEDSDRFIRRDRTRRTEEQIANTGARILLELEDMLNPEVPLYPNMTKDCSWECEFRDVCMMVERNEHWDEYLEESTINRSEENVSWRQFL